jgi:hypothetical protein
MVFEHMSSKDIARSLSISPHTVDQRLRLAMRTLGVASRVEAARLLADAEGEHHVGYQGLIYQTPGIALDSGRPSFDAETVGVRRHGSLHRVGWTVLIVAAVALAFASIFVGLNALSEFTR